MPGRCRYCGAAIWTLDDLSDVVVLYDGYAREAGVWCSHEHYELDTLDSEGE